MNRIKRIVNILADNSFSEILQKLYRKIQDYAEAKKYARMSRRETFSYIYKNDKWEENKWGGGLGDGFYSGPGSWDFKFVEPYVELISNIIKEKQITSIVDFGCGDFNIGSHIVKDNSNVDYIGVDIVPELIERNRNRFKSDNVRFECMDIVDEEKLPDADLCLIKEVFQHLGNKEIMQVLPKLKKYKYVIITDNLLKENPDVNKDVAHGHHSGRYLNDPPFNICVKPVLEIENHLFDGYVLTSMLYEPN
jgi:2-polyprenyl-3-methyl-5-hydroxy-6-metoxy-1,4-benzoquinol methylase